MGKECHPLLSGRRKARSNYSHGFSSAEMQTLATICDTILPSIPLEEKQDHPAGNKALEYFYKASGSQAPIPDEVAEILVKRGLIEAGILIRVILMILSTKLGTFLLCGSLCLSKKWPFINRFSCMSFENREKVLQKWFKHWFLTPVRVAFMYIKALCLFVFLSRVILLFIITS
ncbi:long-chain-alcohol oxidase FAO1-like [Pistacia vera]|uniref:long-chain-alcohol oxidase FAO1-like n=1 Tax=Pistacia vera TaxID=55513 RepID=UPI0012639233|nr:long-chain-alcohol oxidase FAO1-like [Pistacia vera]